MLGGPANAKGRTEVKVLLGPRYGGVVGETNAVPLNVSSECHAGRPCEACGASGYIPLEVIAPELSSAPTSLQPVPMPPMLANEDGWLTMAEAAAKCRCSLWWFSRNWKGWGLHPSQLARLLFDKKEIDALLKGRRISRRGRPRKVTGV